MSISTKWDNKLPSLSGWRDVFEAFVGQREGGHRSWQASIFFLVDDNQENLLALEALLEKP